MNLFEQKTGVFVPLTPDQLNTLSDTQHSAYDSVVAAWDELTAANAEATDARAHNQQCVKALDEAHAAEAKRRKWTPLDEVRAMIAAGPTGAGGKRPEPAPEPNTDVQDAQAALTESHVWLRSAAARQSEARGAVALAVQHWQVAVGGTQSHSDLVREHLKSENEQRAARVAGRIPERGRPGPSAIDQYAYYTRATGRSSGGSRSFARGGMSQTQAMRALQARQRQGGSNGQGGTV